MATRDDCRKRLCSLMLASLVLSVVPACTASAGHGVASDQVVAQPAPDRVVMRPAYPIQGTRPIYLKGYAGLRHGPDRQLNTLEPTGYYERTPRPFGWWLRPRAWAP